MSSSARKDSFYLLGIHKAPPHLSKKEFETGIEALVADWDALPIVKNTGLKSGMILSNDLLNTHLRATGMPEPRPTAILMIEAETPDHLVAALRDAEATELIAGAEQFKPERGACLFSAQATAKIDKPGPKERVFGIAILKVPHDLPIEQYERKLDAISDRFVALPIIQKYVLKSTLWRPDEVSMETHTEAMGVPAPEHTFVAQDEYESQDRLMEITRDVGVQQLLEDAKRDLNLAEGFYFAADVIM